MQQETSIRQAEAPLLGAGQEDQRTGARHPAGANHPHRCDGIHEADHVVDRIAALDMAARRVDVDVNRLRVGREREQAPGHVARHLVVDCAEYQHLALPQQPAFQLVYRRREGLVLVRLPRSRTWRHGDIRHFRIISTG